MLDVVLDHPAADHQETAVAVLEIDSFVCTGQKISQADALDVLAWGAGPEVVVGLGYFAPEPRSRFLG
jgi:hypothetical protein